MYNVSSAFKTMLKKEVHVEHVRGTIGGVAFDDSNIIKMSYSNRCSDTKDVTFGSAYVGQLQVTFWNVNISRGSWRNKKIILQYGLELADSSIEYIPAGVFYVSKATWSDQGITVVANDIMANFDKELVLDTTVGTPWDFLNLAAVNCGVQVAISQQAMSHYPNGTAILGVYAENDMKTWRDFLSWVAVTVGGFATATRDGKITIKSWADLETVDSLTDYNRIAGSTFSDYDTRYNGITITDIQTDTVYYYGSERDGTYIALGKNPLLQYGTDSIKEQQRGALATVAQGIEYTPFTTSVLSSMVYDLGDLITCSAGLAGNTPLTCCVMDIQWTYKSTTLLGGYGADPSLTAGKTATDKALNGVASKQKGATSVTLFYTNASTYQVNSTWREIGSIMFAVTEDQTVEVKGVVRMTVGKPGNFKLRYKKNGDVQPSTEIPFIHEVQFPTGVDTITFLFPINVNAETMNIISLEICADPGEADIAVQDIWMSLVAVGGAEVEWDGTIRVSDHYLFTLGANGIGTSYEDEIKALTITTAPAADEFDDEYDIALGEGILTDYTDAPVDIIMRSNAFKRITNDGDQRITEDEEDRITEGD